LQPLRGKHHSAPESPRLRSPPHKQLPDLPWTPADTETLQTTYHHLQKLHQEGKDGIWARLLKNLFAPLTIGQFDYIVGNPPWINWEHLPDGYRQSIAPIWIGYGLFQQKGMKAAFTKDDISVLMTYVAADKLLKDGGRLGFIITQSVFKSELGGKGFRQLRIPQPNNQFCAATGSLCGRHGGASAF
jgi:hypothetical protein